MAVVAAAVVSVPLLAALWRGEPWGWPAVFAVPVWVSAAAVAAGFHGEAPVPSRRWWVAAAVGVPVAAASAVTGRLSAVSVAWAWVVVALLVAVVVRPWSVARREVPARDR
ncbi:hypothetical protein EKG83_23960 [Saccharothrix syringae]|uniref:Uncharacterized protein n=1 Tax=Saccharothrix syringae TaxID=103733 RepID=A0A5Q0H2M5_SACSY|nr:hypothetical protein EKG83_23960 [Saccharothrix syringae]